MPTGYTYPVVEGTVTEFSEFALSCARAFGALISMRDDPADAPIPEEFKPSKYNEERLAASKARLAELQAMTPEQAETAADADYDQKIAQHNDYARRQADADARLNAMLEKVGAWTPPTAEHVGLKEFMTEQIIISKSGDYRSTPPEALPWREWLREQIEQAHKDVGYHAAEHAKEIERTRGRTEWVKALRQSLENGAA